MLGIAIALMGFMLVAAGLAVQKLRVRSVFGVCDEWSEGMANQNAVLPWWFDGVLWTGWASIAFGLAAFVAS